MELTPYLNFNGQCEEAFKFYEACLGGKIESMMRYEGSPMAQEAPAGWGQKILHVRMTVGGQALMGADALPPHFQKPQGFSITLGLNDPAEAQRIFHALAENGTVTVALQKTFWAARFGMLVDRFGTPWMINCEKAAVKAA